MSWCEYCIDRSSFFSTNYKCIKKNKEDEIPEGYVKWYCSNGNVAYAKCPIYNGDWYITTATSNIVGRGGDTLVINNILSLKTNEFEKDKKYNNFLELYKVVGPIISCRLLNSVDADERAAKIYSKLETMSELIKNNDNSRAAKRYIMMTLRLVAEYGLQDLYRIKRDNIKKTLDL